MRKAILPLVIAALCAASPAGRPHGQRRYESVRGR